MKVSIAMATYNGSQYLQEQLNSFVDQIYKPDELVITDDCSNDNTIQIIENFAQKSPFAVRLYQNKKNLGCAANFNKALSLSKGDFVFLSDQDDVWFPEKIATIIKIAEMHPEILLFINDAAITKAELQEVGFTKLDQINSAGFKDNVFVMGCCVAVRRELLEFALPILKGYKAHDNWIVKFADGMGRKQIYNKVLQYYRRHDTNESLFIANQTKKVTRFISFKSQILTLIKRNNLEGRNNFLQQEKIFLDGVRNARHKCKTKYSNELRFLEKKIEEVIFLTEKRVKIRKKSCFLRIFPVIKMWLQGDYIKFAGLKTAMRDIVFK